MCVGCKELMATRGGQIGAGRTHATGGGGGRTDVWISRCVSVRGEEVRVGVSGR